MYNAREIYDMIILGAKRQEIPATDYEIDEAIIMFEDELDLNVWQKFDPQARLH